MKVKSDKQPVKEWLIALGANLPSELGDAADTIGAALERLGAGGEVRLGARSRLYRSPAMPAGAGPDFVNAAAILHTALPPDLLLAHLHTMEVALGRSRTRRWEARVLDIDLLACGAMVLPDRETLAHWIDLPEPRRMAETPETLILPHPRLQERAFVLAPLNDIAPGWVHPLLGRTVAEMLAALDPQEAAAVVPLDQGARPR